MNTYLVYLRVGGPIIIRADHWREEDDIARFYTNDVVTGWFRMSDVMGVVLDEAKG